MLFVYEKEKYLSTLKLFCHTCSCQLYTEGQFLQLTWVSMNLLTIASYGGNENKYIIWIL